MGIGNVLSKTVSTIATRARYGKQIGKASKSGLVCYEKTNKTGRLYTTVNSKTGEVVRTKQFANEQDNYFNAFIYDAKGDLIRSTTYLQSPNGFGLASRNSQAFNTRVVSKRYNALGQTIDSRDINFKINSERPRAFVHSYINNSEYGTYVNTLTGEKRTFQCIGGYKG